MKNDTKTAPSAGRLVMRLLVGGTLLAIENTGRALRHLEAGGPDQSTTNTPPSLPTPTATARHVLIGALAVGPEWVSERTNDLIHRGHDALAGVKRASRPLRFVARLLPTNELRRWSNEARARAVTAALYLADVGMREEPIARSLARAAAAAGMTGVLDHIANSPQVQTVIREQSAGMGRSALSDLRAQSARADAIAESVAGHFLPHSGRKPPSGSGSP